MPVRWSESQNKAIVDRRGRPRSEGSAHNYLRVYEGYESVPEEILLDEGAPVELLTVAQLTNFLNGYEMTPIVENLCSRWGVNAGLVAKDRKMYASQIQTMRSNMNTLCPCRVAAEHHGFSPVGEWALEAILIN